MIHDPRASLDPQPHDWPVLVTGAAGFVGGHIARHIAQAGHYVRGLVRGQPPSCPDDPKIEWISGDVRDPAIRRRAVAGVRAVIHAAGWVSLGRDAGGLSQAINVEATRGLLDDAKRAAHRTIRADLDPSHPGGGYVHEPGR